MNANCFKEHGITATQSLLELIEVQRTCTDYKNIWLHHRLNTNRDWKRGGAAEIRRVMPQNGCISFERAVTQHKNMKDTTNTGSYS